ncbi:uncharacterized protein EV422DRAFT_578839 [Fimicolochytrium jonesii]|uniref:uncharacterized protein n=1 Tax=Fimicolochytrium jonesii TaxID=1396493 RepID=UPI0022FF1899|nr:uncharacterized protein EV422DRAFT_578839 [Fimicolochytrium jonesii]KAI8820545.1 hypothetical protein EV422DRAFT_578839 [Fimicolochytrium jonesii]
MPAQAEPSILRRTLDRLWAPLAKRPSIHEQHIGDEDPEGSGDELSEGDLESGPSQSAPLLSDYKGNSRYDLDSQPHARAPRRTITAEGVAIIIYPYRTGPPAFSLDLPPSLDDAAFPSTLYRSHVAELNVLYRNVHTERQRQWKILWGLNMAIGVLCLFSALWTLFKQRRYTLSLLWSLTFLALILFYPTLARWWFADLSDAFETQITRSLFEWNTRAPKNVRFRIIGTAAIASHPRYGRRDSHSAHSDNFHYHASTTRRNIPSYRRRNVDTSTLELTRDDEDEGARLIVELLDPGRVDGERDMSFERGEVLITPDGDGMMLAVKVVPRAARLQGG